MDVRVVGDDDLERVGVELVLAGLAAAGRADATLMPALGASALGVYRALGRLAGARQFDTSAIRLVQLDEYDGLAESDPRLLYKWLRRDVAGPLGIPARRIIRLRGGQQPALEACRAYDAAVAAAGGIDVAVLGLGPNGHLGFNEPPSDANVPTREVRLSEASLASNATYWPGLAVPKHALTAGMSTILAARRILLVVNGERKRVILERLLTGRVTPDLPASFLRRLATATLLVDHAAWPARLRRPEPGIRV